MCLLGQIWTVLLMHDFFATEKRRIRIWDSILRHLVEGIGSGPYF